jgi:hypothetical protein
MLKCFHMESEKQFHRVLAAIDLFAQKVDSRFDSLDDRFVLVDDRFKDVGGRLTAVEQCVSGLKDACVTRDYLDQQLLDVRGDIATLVRKEDYKVNSLLEVLHVRKVISDAERGWFLSMGPYPDKR